jgi:hypothetical protein
MNSEDEIIECHVEGCEQPITQAVRLLVLKPDGTEAEDIIGFCEGHFSPEAVAELIGTQRM